ncbi:Protein of unknown function [Thermobacillus xylanilyticus]|nr:Protein of unknown function [Thermobacillus xylanilyticus]
MRRGMAP